MRFFRVTTERDGSGRLLRLLSLLQSGRESSGADLADRLGVTDRTVRRYVDKLRALDYPVRGVTGSSGGYRLDLGTNLPPLQFDAEEAVAVAVGLTAAAGSGVAGVEEGSQRALAKLEQVLPVRLRPRLAALTGSIAAVAPHPTAPLVDPAVLDVLALCCRDRKILTFGYRDRAGGVSVRRVEPHSLVTVATFWYLLAFDPDRDDWRTFRVDRIDDVRRTHRTAAPRELPAPDAATYLARSFATAEYRHTARITVALPAATVRARLHVPLHWSIEVRSPDTCAIRLGADTPDLVTRHVAEIAALGAGFTLDTSAEIAVRIHALGQRLLSVEHEDDRSPCQEF